MKNGYEIKWTKHAVKELSDTMNYLEENWTKREIRHLSYEIEKIISIISNNPDIYEQYDVKRNIRKVIVAKFNSLYYRKNNDIIEVLSFFSNRQNPKHLQI